MSSADLGILNRWFRREKQSHKSDGAEPVSPILVPANEMLVQLAGELLYEVVPLRGLNCAPDIDELRARLITQVRSFHRNVMEAGIYDDVQKHASYVLCTLLDEVISNSDWGQGVWSKQSLLMIFHNETSGGEGFFVRLDTAELKPSDNLALLELMYLCLALGLEGRYRVQTEGRATLALRRRQLYETIRLQRGDRPSVRLSEEFFVRGLTPYSKGERFLGWAICFFLLSLLIAGAYYLEERSYRQLQAIQALRPPQSTSVAQTLAERLATDIEAARLALIDDGRSVRIILSSNELFASGAHDITERTRLLLLRVASALGDWPGRIQVIGHSDDTPAAGLLVSNYALSLARAQSILTALVGENHDPVRFQAEGRGASEPLFPNDSAVHRARNRRVEILVYAPESPAGT